MSFLGKSNFYANGHAQISQSCCVIQSDMCKGAELLVIPNSPMILL